LISKGDSTNTSLDINYVAYRDKVNQVSLSANLSSKRSKNYLADQLLTVSSRNISVLDLSARWQTRFFSGLLAFDFSHAWGLKVLNALDDTSNLPDQYPHAQFRKWTAGASWMRPFNIGGQNFLFSTAVKGQKGMHVLYGSEKFFIGGLYSVRGFRNGSIAGDEGYYWRNELSMPLKIETALRPLNIKPFFGYDMGSVSNHYGVIGGDLSGLAFGLSASMAPVSMNLTVAKALKKPSRLEDEKFQLFANIAISF
jgi:hemolysin activation/secretion protein